MELDPEHNKYTKYFDNIVSINEYLCAQAQEQSVSFYFILNVTML